MSHLIPENLSAAVISRIAICAALVLAPLMAYSSAYLVNSQMAKVTNAQQSVQTITTTKVFLTSTDNHQIAAAIALAYPD